MKHAILAISLLIVSASAEIPDTLKDPATREVAEYLDAKAGAAEKVTRNFSVPTATTTFAGWVDIGLEPVQTTGCGGSVNCDATCPTGKKVISCSFYSPNGVTFTMANNVTYCRGVFQAAGGTIAALCARVK